ncbi:MAG TPA: recombinase family protein [Candidatus Krumholzibacteria bacterium]|nr:recombinase family protein [Candidatus Krumholzibacteria bacterium]HPD73323.1 recombinase family protein [Candidatus Krumholzibacteria bacterium]HRY42039.1 recombinase family protein [Candidatus Krumholzibacteria bacterium]
MAPHGKQQVQQVRCAIYTRVSTVDQAQGEFTSIDNQREMAEAYIKSQAGKGWVLLDEHFDDSGYSAGTVDRPALQRLLAAIAMGSVDVVVAYRLDRLSRSLSDFMKLMDRFTAAGVAFVSVTEAFATDTAVGRLTMGLLATFAQFERETIADRTRDKIHAARRKGKWTGGIPILGYRVAPGGGRLEIDPEGAEMVREIFRLYLADQSVSEVVEEVNCRGWTTKEHVTKTGRRVGGQPFNKSSVNYLLKNPTYAGKLTLKGELYDGEHPAIIDDITFQRVQDLLRKNGSGAGGPNGNKYGYLLKGLVRCAACNAAMTPSTARRGQKVFRYYTCVSAQKHGYATCPCPTISAQKLEDIIVQQIRVIGQDRELQRATLAQVKSSREARRPALVGEQKRLRRRLEKVRADIRSLLDALAVGERGASVGARIAELEAEAEKLERRLAEVAQELAGLDADAVDEADLRKALSLFDPIWDVLYPVEQARVIQLLVERIEHDARTGKLAIEFRPTGISALADEVDAATTMVTA